MNQPVLASGGCPLVLALQAGVRPDERRVEPRLAKADASGGTQAVRSSPDRGEPVARKTPMAGSNRG